MNKRGDLSETIKTLGGIVIGIAALIIVLYVLMSVYKIFFIKEVDQETKDSFRGLEQAFKNLDEGEIIFKFSKGFPLVFFDGGKGNFGSGKEGYYIRPPSCFDKACVVMCRGLNKKEACVNSKYLFILDVERFSVGNEIGILYPAGMEEEYVVIYFRKKDDSLVVSFEPIE
jgi:hypothetical protein